MTDTNILEWQDELAQLALSNSILPVLWLSKEGRLVRHNNATLEFLKYASKDLEGLTLFDINEELTKKSWRQIWVSVSSEQSITFESQLNDSEGLTRPVEMTLTSVTIGTLQLCCAIAVDISERYNLKTRLQEANLLMEMIVNERSEESKRTLDALQKRNDAFNRLQNIEERNKLILDSAGEGIYGLDNQGFTTFVNEAAIKMVGWKLEELVGKSQHKLIHHTKSDGTPYHAADCPIYEAFSDGQVHTVDNEIFWRKDGTSFPVEYTSTPIKNEAGEISGAVVVFRDITQRRKAELEIKETNITLQQTLEEVETLKSHLEEENKYLQQEINLTHNFTEIISHSKKFKKVLSQVEQVAVTGATVLITGESGTGKELIARAVHNLSKRKDRTLVKLNCAALPANLIESELFGHERGAFTGAINRRIGRFELADGGTIFLDEIGELPIELQPNLLRVLQEGEFERLGSSRTYKVDVRVITATNRNLVEEIEKGNFREDLYYRLNVFPIWVPPLRERPEDIPLLVNHFKSKFENRLGKKSGMITKKVMDNLLNYPWGGNVRELENVIERAVIISRGNKLDLGDSLPKTFGTAEERRLLTLEENERNHILKTLKLTTWRVSGEKGAAKLLGINRTTLEARMKKLNIRRP